MEEKLEIVARTLDPGASVAEVARTHGVNANLVFTWRRKYRQGQMLGGKKDDLNLLPVRVVRTTGNKEERPRSAQAHQQPLGQIQIELPKVNLMLTGSVDIDALRAVLGKLLG